MAVLTGPAGIGKTTALREVSAQLKRAGKKVISIEVPPGQAWQLPVVVTGILGRSVEALSAPELDRCLKRIIAARRGPPAQTVIIDNAHLLQSEVLEFLSRLTAPNAGSVRQVLLAGRPELWISLKNPDVLEVFPDFVIRRELEPLPREEARAFVAHWLGVSEPSMGEAIAEPALEFVLEAGQGLPGRIAQLLDRPRSIPEAHGHPVLAPSMVSLGLLGEQRRTPEKIVSRADRRNGLADRRLRMAIAGVGALLVVAAWRMSVTSSGAEQAVRAVLPIADTIRDGVSATRAAVVRQSATIHMALSHTRDVLAAWLAPNPIRSERSAASYGAPISRARAELPALPAAVGPARPAQVNSVAWVGNDQTSATRPIAGEQGWTEGSPTELGQEPTESADVPAVADQPPLQTNNERSLTQALDANQAPKPAPSQTVNVPSPGSVAARDAMPAEQAPAPGNTETAGQAEHGPGALAPQSVVSETVITPVAPAKPAQRSEPTAAVQTTTGRSGTGAPTLDLASASASLVMPEPVIQALLAKGNSLFALGDVSGARLCFERAAAAGSPRGAAALGKTYDPAYLIAINVTGMQPDPDAAANWYRTAAARGDLEAPDLLRQLGAKHAWRETR